MGEIVAAVAHCERNGNGLLKLGGLWLKSHAAHSNLSTMLSSLLKRNEALSHQVVRVKTGKREDRGFFATEEVAKQLAECIPVHHLWRESMQVGESSGSDQGFVGATDSILEEPTESAPSAQPANQAIETPGDSFLFAELGNLLQRPIHQLRITPDGELALIDVAMIFTGSDSIHASASVRNLLAQYPEFIPYLKQFHFPGRGQRDTHVAPAVVALEFAFMLPGKNSALVRKGAAVLMVRCLGGDESMVDRILQNRRVQEALAVETEPTAQQTMMRSFGRAVESQSVLVRWRRPSAEDAPARDDLYVMQYAEYTPQGFVVDDTRVKIGRARIPKKRQRGLEASQDFYVKIVATFPGCGHRETDVHVALAAQRSSRGAGVEWFSISAATAVAEVMRLTGVSANLECPPLERHRRDS